MNIVIDPLIPLWLIIVVGVAATLFAALSLWRNWKSGVFRSIAAACLVALLLNPLLREAETTPLEDIALILVDKSASQSLDERDRVAEEAAAELETSIANLGGVETRIVEFDGAEETRAVDALKTAMADTPAARLGGVFLITDGQAADAEEAASLPTGEAPVHTSHHTAPLTSATARSPLKARHATALSVSPCASPFRLTISVLTARRSPIRDRPMSPCALMARKCCVSLCLWEPKQGSMRRLIGLGARLSS